MTTLRVHANAYMINSDDHAGNITAHWSLAASKSCYDNVIPLHG